MSLLKVFFARFPIFKKVRHHLRTRGRHCPRTLAHGRRLLMTSPWRPRRRTRTSLTMTSCTLSLKGSRGSASGTQLTSGIAGGWPRQMGQRLAMQYGSLHGSSAVDQGDDAVVELLCRCLVRQCIHVCVSTWVLLPYCSFFLREGGLGSCGRLCLARWCAGLRWFDSGYMVCVSTWVFVPYCSSFPREGELGT